MLFHQLNEKVFQALKASGNIEQRPNTTPGIWLGFLLPAALLISTVTHPKESSSVYHQTALLSLGLALTSVIFIVQCVRAKDIRLVRSLHSLPGAIIGISFLIVLEKDFLFSFVSGFLSGIGYYQLFLFLLRRCKCCFTVGEAQIAAQAGILLMYSGVLTIWRGIVDVPYTNLDLATLTISVGLLNICFLCMCCYLFPSLRNPTGFYTVFAIICLFGIVIPLWILMRKNPLIWMLTFMLKNLTTIKILFYWILCSILAVIAINSENSAPGKASTSLRKVFHLLAIAVYIPGLIYECTLLFLASGVVLGIFIVLELIRILGIPPLGDALQSAFYRFSDDKDSFIALSPIYLLIGVSAPIWLHPAPCDITDSCGFYFLPLVSGLVTVGIGDTAASIIGSRFGYHKWPGSKKSVEGTVACVVTQLCSIFLLLYCGLIMRGHLLLIKASLAAILTSLVEACTTQVDNHTLPLLMYIVVML